MIYVHLRLPFFSACYQSGKDISPLKCKVGKSPESPVIGLAWSCACLGQSLWPRMDVTIGPPWDLRSVAKG